MAVNLGSLLVSLGLDSGEFKSGLDQAEKEMRRTERNFDKLGKKMAGIGQNLSIAVTAPLAALGVASFKAASDAAEMESAFDVSFGGAADSVKKWAEDTGNAMGRSTQEMMGMAASFQDILKKQMNPGEASELSKTLTVLTQDLASFKNLSNDVAQQKIFSGLIGEAEPLRSVGVLLDATAVDAKALEMGLAATRKEISEGAKVQARAALIMDQLSDAQGDVIRTSDSTANRLKTASAAFEEMRVAIGQKLIPALTPFITALTNVIEGFNRLSPGMQTAIVSTAAFAAAIGPLIFVVGNLTSLIAPLIAGIKGFQASMAVAGVQVGKFSAAMALARASIVLFIQTVGPMLALLAAVAGAYYLATRRTQEQTDAQARLAAQQDIAKVASDRLKGATDALSMAYGEAREAALAAARAEYENTKQKRDAAWWTLQMAEAELKLAQVRTRTQRNSATGGVAGTAGFIQGMGDREVAAKREEVDGYVQILKGLEKDLKDARAVIQAPAPVTPSSVSVPPTSTGSKSVEKASGRSPAEIEEMFAAEQRRLEMEALAAKERLTTNIEDRVDLQYEILDLERQQRLAEIDASADFSTKQKDALRKQVEALYGAAVQIDEQGKIIATGNQGLIAQQIEQDRAFELEREAMDMERVRFDNQRELLELDYELADTQGERALIAADILRLEQEYRRNQLEMVIASKTSSDAEKRRAQAILDSLGAFEAGERAASARRNETDAQRYSRELNKTGAQMSEEIDRIKINGLESLNDALTDAIVNFKSLKDVVSSVVKSVLSDLIRLQLQQAIIRPLANAMGLGIPGFATGTSFAPGGLAVVGEKGPEIMRVPRGSRIYTNGVSKTMLGGGQGGGWQGNMYVTTPDADSFRRSDRQISRDLNRRLNQ